MLVICGVPKNCSVPLGTAKDVEQAVMHALEKSAEKRPATVAEWLEELEKAAGDEDDEQRQPDDPERETHAPPHAVLLGPGDGSRPAQNTEPVSSSRSSVDHWRAP